MAAVLLDTNVLVYFLDPRDPARQDRAIQIVKELGSRSAACLSVQCLSELMNVVIHKLSPWINMNEAIQQTQLWIAAFPVYELTSLIVLEAARGVRDHRLAYYDAQIWATARLNQVQVVFSEDFPDGSNLEGVRFVNPFATGFALNLWV